MRDIYPYLGIGKPAPGPVDHEVMQDILEFLTDGKGPFWSEKNQEDLEKLVLAQTNPNWLQIIFDLVITDSISDCPWILWGDYTILVYMGGAVARYPEIGVDMLILLFNDVRYRLFALEVLLYASKSVREQCLAALEGQETSFTEEEQENWDILMMEKEGGRWS